MSHKTVILKYDNQRTIYDRETELQLYRTDELELNVDSYRLKLDALNKLSMSKLEQFYEVGSAYMVAKDNIVTDRNDHSLAVDVMLCKELMMYRANVFNYINIQSVDNYGSCYAYSRRYLATINYAWIIGDRLTPHPNELNKYVYDECVNEPILSLINMCEVYAMDMDTVYNIYNQPSKLIDIFKSARYEHILYNYRAPKRPYTPSIRFGFDLWNLHSAWMTNAINKLTLMNSDDFTQVTVEKISDEDLRDIIEQYGDDLNEYRTMFEKS